jgi:sugar/nucleoside kinase (ribokinase family)
MITDRGAAAELDAIDAAWLNDARWLHAPLYGFAASASREAITDAAALLTGRQVPVSLDLSSIATMRELGRTLVQEIIDRVAPSVVFANADEAAAAAELGLDLGAAVRVVKRGGDPVLLIADGAQTEIPVRRVDDVIDSTGAGDAFAAGYIAAALRGADGPQSVREGSELAVSALRRPGAL